MPMLVDYIVRQYHEKKDNFKKGKYKQTARNSTGQLQWPEREITELQVVGLPWSGPLTDKGCLCSAVSEAPGNSLYSTTLQTLVGVPTSLHCVTLHTELVQFIAAILTRLQSV